MLRARLAAAFFLVFSCLFGVAPWFHAVPALAGPANEAMIIDLEGPTGGFNLQICWSTGFTAGSAAEKQLIT